MSRPWLALGVGFATLLVSPASASAPVPTGPQAEFTSSFAAVASLPSTPEARGNVVDISEIEPPLEVAIEDDGEVIGSGNASYYGRKFQGRRTASGERFDMNDFTAAHRTLPFGTRVRVTNEANGKSVVVRINDRGPFSGHRILDLSRAAASEIGIVGAGHGRVELARLD
ncbi:septal ring lytic transglycosylase RlpA family protein [Erythrobacter sp. 3-20A1M]|uniref:septal ring lytic transglycosylase RlpA family protein n=1 Tax=Erythrobacter sp. 3-20A1M TaxID=2653850 RepID=UPI001BFC3598|nr:septal ring lytic transglycosylase RlpA family protein [Erythrobacter sp. 3-20A1M]QWC55886.1 septal ring lytic transglycosylase RlpA family protein [Erythrobacter sp. 3-20A1M]